eukprot:9377724-Karenia_brevis.AAC.1
MHKVYLGTVSWSVGAMGLTQNTLQKFRAGLFRKAKGHMNVTRLRGETDNSYHKRLGKAVKEAQYKFKLPDVDVLFLRRKYDYAGHIVRLGRSDTSSLLLKAIMWKCKGWQREMQEAFGCMGHSGR